MNLIIQEQDGLTLAKIEGRIGMAEASEMEQKMRPLLLGDNPNIEIDCRDLTYISSSGLRLLFTLQKSVNERKGTLVLTHMQDSVKRVFNMTGFSKLIKVQ
ncbi:MAG: STAS domain-containing protein [Bacteroidales bacterium]|nr:STAS domain-containing protein [Bacteroidales bacterium]